MRLKKGDLIEIANMSNNNMPISQIASKFNYNVANMRRIIKRYHKHGIEGILHKADSNNFPIEFKIEIINRYYSGESKNSLATEINVNIGVIISWIKKYEQLGYNGLIDNRGRPGVSKMGRPRKNEQFSKVQTELTNDEREELNMLRKKTRRLEMEIEATKKLNALVQTRIERETPKKQS